MTPEDFHAGVTQRLICAREAAGFETAADAARAIGMKPVTYRAWENGQNNVAETQYARICQVFGVTVDWLLTGANVNAVAEPARDDGARNTTVVPAQHEIEVYQNTVGAVVLKMDAGGVYDEDQLVIIRPEHVERVVEAMQRVKAEIAAQ